MRQVLIVPEEVAELVNRQPCHSLRLGGHRAQAARHLNLGCNLSQAAT